MPSAISETISASARSSPARRSGVEKSLPSVSARHSTCDSGSAASSSFCMAPAPEVRIKLSGSSPAGRKAKRRLWPGFKLGSASRAARWAAERPAASPSNAITGSGATRQSRCK